MKPLISISLLSVCCLSASAAAPAAKNRERPFNSDWRFLRAEAPGAEAPAFDDSKWRMLDVPHDWSTEDLPPLQKPPVPELSVVTGQWRFQKGDNAAWKVPNLDDSGWRSVTLPETWERHSDYTNDNVYGWFRRRIEIPTDCKGKDFDLLLGCIDDVDETFLNGERVPNADILIRFTVGGAGELAAQASSSPNDATSFGVPARKTYEGRCLAILRPNGTSGKITLKAEAD